ncbi:hypothetical protein BV25DRAFT_1802829, partial [Artomyces pyxidatus]
PPAKKRKRNNQNNGRNQGGRQHVQHWDDPSAPPQSMPYNDRTSGSAQVPMDTSILPDIEDQEEAGEEEEESRELTQDEIWDDSALIEAWESANAEYEAYHGKGKAWKEESVKKSPLWYNVPPPPSKLKQRTQETGQPSKAANPTPDKDDSHPINFDTFVPDHDPTLATTVDASAYQLAEAPGERVSRDEAFNRALNAMYWTGYWTAVYHVSPCMEFISSTDMSEQTHQQSEKGGKEDEMGDGEYEEEGDEEVGGENDLVPTQR